MKRKVLLPRSDTARWQIYPSDDEVLLVKMLTKYSELERSLPYQNYGQLFC